MGRGRGFTGQATEARAKAPLPGPPLRLRRKGGGRALLEAFKFEEVLIYSLWSFDPGGHAESGP